MGGVRVALGRPRKAWADRVVELSKNPKRGGNREKRETD